MVSAETTRLVRPLLVLLLSYGASYDHLFFSSCLAVVPMRSALANEGRLQPDEAHARGCHKRFHPVPRYASYVMALFFLE